MAKKNIKLSALDGSPIDSAELSEDFRTAEKVGPFRVGRTAFYYRDGLRKHVIPLAVIDQALTQVEPVITHVDTGPMDIKIYHLFIYSEGIQLAGIRTEDEEQLEAVQALLKNRIPGIMLGEKVPE
ncbi:MAG: hypothetical protein EOM54_11135 [Clostridia bacterium]|nr:hypothetical protein [Clostridia bacterium]